MTLNQNEGGGRVQAGGLERKKIEIRKNGD